MTSLKEQKDELERYSETGDFVMVGKLIGLRVDQINLVLQGMDELSPVDKTLYMTSFVLSTGKVSEQQMNDALPFAKKGDMNAVGEIFGLNNGHVFVALLRVSEIHKSIKTTSENMDFLRVMTLAVYANMNITNA